MESSPASASASASAPSTAIVIRNSSRGWCCCRMSKDRFGFTNVLQSLHLSDVEKEIIQIRYLSMLENFQKRAQRYAILFFVGHFIITVGSLFVPALLSVQNSTYATTHSEFGSQVYWITFALSLLVTMCNGMLTLFKVDKKYYFLNTTMERLRSEGWQYVGLTGRYSGHGIVPTHKNQFLTFTHHIEKIKMKQVEEEYHKMEEKTDKHPPGAPASNAANELYPLSPDKPLSMMKQTVPGPVQDTVQSFIDAQQDAPVDLRALSRVNTRPRLLSGASSPVTSAMAAPLSPLDPLVLTVAPSSDHSTIHSNVLSSVSFVVEPEQAHAVTSASNRDEATGAIGNEVHNDHDSV